MSTAKLLQAMLIIALGTKGGCLLAQDAQTQRSPKRSTFSIKHIPSGKGRVICPIFKKTKYPYQGIGIKLGDPTGITYKLYPNPNWAFVGSVGFVASGLHSRYYKNAFNEYIPKTLATSQSMSYLSHEVPIDWCFQTKALYQLHIDALFKGLQFYIGLGWQWKITNLKYSYAFSENDPVTGRNKILNFNASRFTYGGLGIIGFEYAYFALPLSAFLEVETVADALLDPGYINFQGSIGVRYVF